jgi:hypothetical protein
MCTSTTVNVNVNVHVNVRSICLALAVGLAACGSTDSGWTITEQRTPADVPHIVNTPPAAGIEPTWTIEPEIRIGSVEGSGPATFGTIKGLGVLSDGRMAVFDAQAQEIRIFGADGQHLRTFGRRGAGPGEFADANGFVIGRDDVIRVNDPRNRRFSFFHPERGFLNSIQAEIWSYGYIWEAVVDTADHVWEVGQVLIGEKDFFALRGYDAQGRWTDTIPQTETASDPRSVYRVDRGTSRSFSQVPYWPRPVATMDPRRAWWSKPSHENDYRIMRVTFSADTTLMFESQRSAAPVAATERDSVIEALRERMGTNLDWSLIPHEKPIVTQLFVAAEGDVWVKVTTAPDSLNTYDVFSPDGRYKGTAVTRLRVSSLLRPVVRGDRFWVIVRDEFDVAYIARGRIVPR